MEIHLFSASVGLLFVNFLISIINPPLFFSIYIENALDRYSSRSFLLISLLLPFQRTNGQFSSFDISRSLPIPTPQYALASSSVKLDFSHNGTSIAIVISPFFLFRYTAFYPLFNDNITAHKFCQEKKSPCGDF